MSKKYLSVCVVVLTCLVGSNPASASVIYKYTADVDFAPEFGQIGFVYTAPDFITPPLTVPASSLDSCDPAAEFPICVNIEFGTFLGSLNPGFISMSFSDGAGGTGTVGIGGFPAADLSTEGTYVVTDDDFVATLTVRQSTAVPEPVSVALFGLGLAGMGARRWRLRTST